MSGYWGAENLWSEGKSLRRACRGEEFKKSGVSLTELGRTRFIEGEKANFDVGLNCKTPQSSHHPKLKILVIIHDDYRTFQMWTPPS
jgi:hypothetical protein